MASRHWADRSFALSARHFANAREPSLDDVTVGHDFFKSAAQAFARSLPSFCESELERERNIPMVERRCCAAPAPGAVASGVPRPQAIANDATIVAKAIL